jgi:hypothetical protein
LAARIQTSIETTAVPDMTDEANGTRSTEKQRNWQFSLRGILLVTLVASIVLGIASQIPAKFVFAASLFLLMLVPLSVAAGLRDLLSFAFAAKRSPLEDVAIRPATNVWNRLRFVWRSFEWLGLWPIEHEQGIRRSLVIAIVCTLVAIGSWPAIREIGGTCAVVSSGRHFQMRTTGYGFGSGKRGP